MINAFKWYNIQLDYYLTTNRQLNINHFYIIPFGKKKLQDKGLLTKNSVIYMNQHIQILRLKEKMLEAGMVFIYVCLVQSNKLCWSYG